MPELKYGVDYGIKLVRNPIISILCNLPIINLFYTKKLHFDATVFVSTGDGHIAPAFGTFADIRVPLFAKKFRVIYALDRGGAEARVSVHSSNREWRYIVSERWRNINISALVWYVSDITLTGKER